MFPITHQYANVQTFFGTGSADSIRMYEKPKGCSMLYIIAVGGGSGGGGGFSGVAGSARGGGGGGASGAQARGLYQINLLPDRLYVQLGRGGLGTTSGQGGSGGDTVISVNHEFVTNINRVLYATGASIGGGTGTATGAGSIGSAGAGTAIGNYSLGGLGIVDTSPGQNGVFGGAQTGAVGQSQSLPTTGLVVMGGAGGAGTTSADFAGGGIAAIAGSIISSQKPNTAAAGSNNGAHGFSIKNYLFHFPGLGGSSSNAGVGGLGGNGSYGCGGGGGGAGTTGGRGGDGGAGFVMFIAW